MEQKSSFNSNTSLVLGIISIVSFFTFFLSPIGVVLGIIGIVLSHKNKDEEQVAKTGFILSIIGLILNGLRLNFWLFFLVF